MTLLRKSTAENFGCFLTRILVPLWIFMGATFKLVAQTPSTLPQYTIFKPAAKLEIDLGIPRVGGAIDEATATRDGD